MKQVSVFSLWLVALVSASTFAGGEADSQPHRDQIILEQLDDPYLPPQIRPGGRSAAGNPTVAKGPWISVQVNTDGLGNNIPGDAANEPSIAIDPTNPDIIVIGWRQFDTIASNFRQAGYGYSHDGGQTWTFPGVHEPGVFRSDPVLSFDTEGNIYYDSLHTDLGDVWRCDIFKTSDGGLSWTKAMFAFGGDKCWLAIDRTGGIGHGNLYEAWNVGGNVYFPNTFSRSIDSALSWLDPMQLPHRPVFGTVHVGPDGEVYVAGVPNSAFTFEFWVVKSTNAQDSRALPSFNQAVQVDMGGALALFGTPNPSGLTGQVWVATDHSAGPSRGNVYVLCSVDPPGGDPMDVKIIRSTDGGLTWSTPLSINDDPAGTNAWQWFGTLAVAPNGRIDVVWNDTRNSGQGNLSELFYAYSTDTGLTWSANLTVSPQFDSHLGWPNQNKLGDYYHMISDTASANLAYAATFNGEQDVYFLRLGDCNNNGTHDGEELAQGSPDLDGNGVLDVCEGGSCAADLDGDGAVGPVDLAMLLASWGPCPGCPADLNADGMVGPDDLALLLASWGPCP